MECWSARSARRADPSQSGKSATRDVLLARVREANARAVVAAKNFTVVIQDVPSGYPFPDGVQRVQSASHELDGARAAVRKAHEQLNDFTILGIVPDDLKPDEQ
jgi:hypothetical protein